MLSRLKGVSSVSSLMSNSPCPILSHSANTVLVCFWLSCVWDNFTLWLSEDLDLDAEMESPERLGTLRG